MINAGPLDEQDWTEHWQRLAASGHGHRREIVTQFDRLDLDEGREVPIGGRRAQFAPRPVPRRPNPGAPPVRSIIAH
jgi:hypothetical protein